MKKIKIKHQVDGDYYEFEVEDPKKLTKNEVIHICAQMGVQALFVEGKYYRPL
tara:strand:+ start:9100 stop:9258 length:159 start_codon:yes stop_codon:yes gene_type:complete